MHVRRGTRHWPTGAAALLITFVASACLPANEASQARSPAPAPVLAPEPPATRSLTQWPFASTSPWNTPLGSGASYDARAVVTLATSTPWINSSEYSVHVVSATTADPLVTVDVRNGTFPGPVTLRIPAGTAPAAGTDAHL